MPKKLGIILLIINIILGIFIFSNIAGFKRLWKNYRSTTKGLNMIATIYSFDGKVLAEYNSTNMYVKVANSGAIEIQMDGKKYIFSNVSVIINEK